MKKILTILLLLPLLLAAQTTPLTYGVIPTSAADLNRPGGGANQWSYDQNIINIPVQGTNTQRLDAYWRFTWLDFQPANGSQNVFSFAAMDNQFHDVINKGQKFSFGVMQQCTSCDANLQNPIGGNTNLLPTWLINAMPNSYAFDGDYYPDYNSSAYLNALKNLSQQINNHIMTTTYMGVRYQDIINFIDVRGYGNFGEWTNNDFSHITPTVASLDSIISYQTHSFNTFQMVVMIGTFSGGQLSNVNVPAAVGYYALMDANAYGKYGWRRDNWGQTDPYITQFTLGNNTTFGGIVFKDSISVRYKYAPVVGEPQDGGSATNFSSFVAQGQAAGGSSFGNGNFNSAVNATIQNNFRAASKAFGYRFVLGTGSNTTTPVNGQTFSITQAWQNVGASPSYENWNCTYDLRVNQTSAPVWTGTSSFKPKLFLPSGSATFITDNFTLTNVPAGTYQLNMTIKDPLAFRFPMPIYITNPQQADGSYIIRTAITVPGSTPTSNAGSNQSITTTSATLSGTGSSGATTYAWTQISGPNTATIGTPTLATTGISGLITGTYVFQLAINGATSGAGIDQVTIIVNAPVVQANAGNNQTITLPASSATLSGSASTGATTYSWTNVSGPTTPAITTPTSVTAGVSGLVAGTYIFQLSINGGASTSQTQVKVLPVPPPAANAGPSQTIALPTSTVTLDGSGSTGTITSYAWTQTQGPNASVIASAGTVTTSVSGLIQGVYTFRLTLNGGGTDTMQVTVNAAAPPIPTGQTIFTTQIPAGGTLKDAEGGGLVGIELGMKFRVNVNGFILGVRFYKTNGNTGAHTAQLYSRTGTLMATATFDNETSTGWQYAIFPAPVAVVAGTTYVAAYFSPSGFYVSTTGQMGTAIVNGNMTALADGTDGNNGVYLYTNTAAFPGSAFGKSNYWVDALFSTPSVNPCNCHPRNKWEKTTILNGF